MAKQDVELQFRLIDGVTKSLSAIQTGVTDLGSSLVKINQAAELTGKAFGAIGAVAGAFGDAVTGAASVEDALTRVNTITAATVEEQKALQGAVRAAVDGTRFSAEEASGALVLLAEDGFSASDAVAQLNTVLEFAQANAQTAAQAAAGLGAVLDTFGENPAVIGELADKLTAVAVGAGTSTKALQEGLAGVGNAADQAGLSLDETIGFLGLLATRGIEGGAAVGNFNKILRELSDPASKAGEALKNLGLDGADFSTIIKRLGSDAGAAEQVLSALGRKPREALRVLLEEGGGDLGKFNQILLDSTGKTRAAAAALNETFAGALDRIRNQLEQTRNDLLTPILAPLADEIQVLSSRLSEFARSEEFEVLVAKFTEFAAKSVTAVGDLIESFDFGEAVQKVVEFVTVASDNFGKIVTAAQVMGQAIATVYDVIKGGAAVLVEAFTGVASAIAGIVGLVSDDAAEVSRLFGDMSTAARGLSDEALADLSERFGLTSQQAALLKTEIQSTAIASRVAAGDFKALEDALPKRGIDTLIAGLGRAGMLLEAEMPKAAKLTEVAMTSLGDSAFEAAVGLERLRVATLSQKIAQLAADGRQASAEFRQYTAEVGRAEQKIRDLIAANAAASGSTDAVAASASNASNSLRNYASAAGGAAAAARELSNANSQVDESFGNIGNQASETAISLGNMTREFTEQAIAATNSARSGREYADIWNAFANRAADQERQIQNRIDALRRMSAAEDEQAQIQRRYEQQYGNSSVALQELIALEQQYAASQQNRPGDKSEVLPAAAQSGGGRGGAVQITINQNGATPETIREIAPLIQREFSRLGFLSR